MVDFEIISIKMMAVRAHIYMERSVILKKGKKNITGFTQNEKRFQLNFTDMNKKV